MINFFIMSSLSHRLSCYSFLKNETSTKLVPELETFNTRFSMKYCSAPVRKTIAIWPTITSIFPILQKEPICNNNSCSTCFTGLRKQVFFTLVKIQLFNEEKEYNKTGVHFLSSGQALNFEMNVI